MCLCLLLGREEFRPQVPCVPPSLHCPIANSVPTTSEWNTANQIYPALRVSGSTQATLEWKSSIQVRTELNITWLQWSYENWYFQVDVGRCSWDIHLISPLKRERERAKSCHLLFDRKDPTVCFCHTKRWKINLWCIVFVPGERKLKNLSIDVELNNCYTLTWKYQFSFDHWNRAALSASLLLWW